MFTTEGFGWELYDSELVDQMGTFIRKASNFASYAAIKGAHDDKIMTLCWAAYMLQPEIIEKYMLVTEFFNTSLDKIMPKHTQPLHILARHEVSKIFEDPLYRQFLQFKAEAQLLAQQVGEAELAEREFDNRYNFQNPNISKQEVLRTRQLEYAQINAREPLFVGGSMIGGIVMIDGNEAGDDGFGYDFSGPEW
jgi:hypothetical protein